MAMSKIYKLVESTDQATHYYLIPQHETMIPKCQNSQRILIQLLSREKDIHSPTMITEYPIVSRKQANLFPWITLTVRIHYKKYVDYKEIAREAIAHSNAKFAKYLDDCGIDLDTL